MIGFIGLIYLHYSLMEEPPALRGRGVLFRPRDPGGFHPPPPLPPPPQVSLTLNGRTTAPKTMSSYPLRGGGGKGKQLGDDVVVEDCCTSFIASVPFIPAICKGASIEV